MLFGEPRKRLEGMCPAGKAPKKALEELERSEAECVEAVGDGLEAGRTVVSRAKADACAAEIRARWDAQPSFHGRTGRPASELEAHPACRDLFEGTVAEGAACKSSVDCRAPLVCATNDEASTCVKPPALGAGCLSGRKGDRLAARSACEPNTYCGSPPMPAATGSRDSAGIAAAVRKNMPSIHGCAKAALEKDPAMQGRVRVQFTIQKDGTVTKVGHVEATLRDKAMVACIEKVVASLKFAPGEEDAVVSFPFVFQPAEGVPVAEPPPAAGKAKPPLPLGPFPLDGGRAVFADRIECRARAAKGEACRVTRGCAEGLVCRDDVCAEPPGDALSCIADADCPTTSRCRTQPSGWRCVPLRATGEACTEDVDCTAGICANGVCGGPCAR